MKILLRPLQTGKQVGTTTMYEYHVLHPTSMTLMPIPEWLNDAKCKCGVKADFMFEDMTFICEKCIFGLLQDCKSSLDTKQELSIPMSIDIIKRHSFEWSVDGGEKWYRVQGRNIKIEGDVDVFLSQIKEALLNNSEMPFDAEYDKDTKAMTIF
jgi:hypothetical protein